MNVKKGFEGCGRVPRCSGGQRDVHVRQPRGCPVGVRDVPARYAHDGTGDAQRLPVPAAVREPPFEAKTGSPGSRRAGWRRLPRGRPRPGCPAGELGVRGGE